MGRELKKVALDFVWPIGQIWKGFLNPYNSQECKSCNGNGLNEETSKIDEEWYSFETSDYVPNPFRPECRYNKAAWSNNLTQDDVQALLDGNRLWDFTRRPINKQQREDVKKELAEGRNSWLPYDNGYTPTAKEVNEWNLKGMGHDAINKWLCVKAKAKKLGVYGECEHCNGEGHIFQSEAIETLHGNCEPVEPPTGEGFQLWETTSEGSPSSPVFETLDLLCEYLEAEKVSVFGKNTATKERWKEMLDDGFVSHQDGNMIFI